MGCPKVNMNIRSELLLFISCIVSLLIAVNSKRSNSVSSIQVVSTTKTKNIQAQTQATATKKKNNNKTVASAATEGIKNALASGLAAALVKVALAPFDTIKTIQQRNRFVADEALSFINAAKVATDKGRGALGLYAGVGVTVVGAMPSVGLYFGVYSYSKRVIGNLLHDTFVVSSDGLDE